MRSTRVSAWRRAGSAVGVVLATAAASGVVLPAADGSPAVARSWSVRVHSGGRDATVTFGRARAGEVFLDVAVSARGVSWAERGNESAVVSAYVDGHYATDIVITSSRPVSRQFALGTLGKGRHTVRFHYAQRRSRSRAGVASLQDLRFVTVPATSPAYAAAAYAPVLYGRNLRAFGGRFANNHTDTPLVAWHQVLPAATPGHSVIEYSVLWSNEDGGTDSAGLMARWGRTTDIEWVYRVEVDARGRRVPGTGVFQAPLHRSLPFHGRYDGSHPLLQTCTSNNNVCSDVDDPMRFALSMREVLPADQPREYEMDRHPWTYQVMAREMVREHKIESPSDPSTPAVGDQRSYLYVAVAHDTVPPAAAADFGLAVDVRLVGDPTTYTSDHGAAFRTLNRDGPAATTVELPLGTRAADVASISVRRVAIAADDATELTVTDLDRAFLLGAFYRPGASFARWHGTTTLTTASPTAELWARS